MLSLSILKNKAQEIPYGQTNSVMVNDKYTYFCRRNTPTTSLIWLVLQIKAYVFRLCPSTDDGYLLKILS